MRACLAILKDAFREAAASRILWLALGAIALVLAVLAPMGLKSVPSTRLRPFELVDTEGLLQSLQQGAAATTGPAHQIWSLLDPKTQETVRGLTPPGPEASDRDRRRFQSRVVDAVNSVLDKENFYSPEQWQSETWQQAGIDESLRSADVAGLTKPQRAARNLKRLAAAFPDAIDIQDEKSLELSYGSMTLFGPLRLPPSQTDDLINEIIIGVLTVFLGFFGVFGSLLVTASIIPRTFEPGEISLLLSKPVRRITIYLTRFAGGCIFTLLCAAELVTGTWLLLGLRFGLWRTELLLCIPLYVFLFAIYYSVSALAGAVWRNAIVSLILVVLFWIVQTTAGVVNGFMTDAWMPGQQIEDVTFAGEQVFAVDGSRTVLRWNAALSDWQPIMAQENPGAAQLLGMLAGGRRYGLAVSPDGRRVHTLQADFSRFGQAGAATLIRGEADEFAREALAGTPEAVFGIYSDSSGALILPGLRNIHQFEGVSADQPDARQWLRGMLGNVVPAGSRGFKTLSTGRRDVLRPDAAVAFSRTDASIVSWDQGRMARLQRLPDGTYQQASAREVAKELAAVIAAAPSRILVAQSDAVVRILDENLNELEQLTLPAAEKPKRCEIAQDGSRGAVLTHSGKIFLWNPGSLQPLPAGGSTRYASISFLPDGRLTVSDRRTLRVLDPVTGQADSQQYTGLQAWPYALYDYLIRPLYRVFPKPSELDYAVRYLVTGETSIRLEDGQGGSSRDNLEDKRIVFDPWGSLWSNVTFIIVMLGCGCLYLIRSDF